MQSTVHNDIKYYINYVVEVSNQYQAFSMQPKSYYVGLSSHYTSLFICSESHSLRQTQPHSVHELHCWKRASSNDWKMKVVWHDRTQLSHFEHHLCILTVPRFPFILQYIEAWS